MKQLCVLFFFTRLLASQGLYFLLHEGQQKCFYEHLPTNVMLTGTYNLLVYDETSLIYLPANRFGVMVVVRDPESKVTLSKTYSAEGRFVFTSEQEGEHTICISANSSQWYGGPQMKIHLQLRTGSHDLNSISHKETFSEVQQRIGLLMQHFELINKEQTYHRHREMAFRQISDHTSLMVIVSTVLLPCVVIVIRLAQSLHLRTFFIAKKLV